MVHAITRLAQKGIDMEIEIIPSRITFDHHGQTLPYRLKLTIVRGPFTFKTKEYEVKDKNQAYMDFEDECFKKESTFYFTDKGAEFKKCQIKIFKIDPENDKESLLVTEEINLSTVISMRLREEIIEIGKNGLEKLEIQCCCRPIGDQKDIDYVDGFIRLDADKDPSNTVQLQTPKGSQSGNAGLFTTARTDDPDPLTLARETKELEQRLKKKDDQIKELEKQVLEAEEENKKLIAEKEEQDTLLKEFNEIQEQQEKLEEQSEMMHKNAMTYRDYAKITDFDGQFGIV